MVYPLLVIAQYVCSDVNVHNRSVRPPVGQHQHPTHNRVNPLIRLCNVVLINRHTKWTTTRHSPIVGKLLAVLGTNQLSALSLRKTWRKWHTARMCLRYMQRKVRQQSYAMSIVLFHTKIREELCSLSMETSLLFIKLNEHITITTVTVCDCTKQYHLSLFTSLIDPLMLLGGALLVRTESQWRKASDPKMSWSSSTRAFRPCSWRGRGREKKERLGD